MNGKRNITLKTQKKEHMKQQHENETWKTPGQMENQEKCTKWKEMNKRSAARHPPTGNQGLSGLIFVGFLGFPAVGGTNPPREYDNKTT